MTRPTDEEAIRALVQAQFESLNCHPASGWTGRPSRAAFFSTRGCSQRAGRHRHNSPTDFIERLRRAREAGTLCSFKERGVGCVVMVVGNVAIAIAGCEMTENEERITRDVSGFLLVKNPDGWKIAAQARDYVEDITEAFAEL